MNLEEIIAQIKSKGSKIHFQVELNNIENALNSFAKIAESILDDEYNIDIVKDVVINIINWSYAISANLDLKKGIMLKGLPGTGKTFIFEILRYFWRIDNLKYLHNNESRVLTAKIVKANQILLEFSSGNGYEVIKKYGCISCLVIDDLGKESEIATNYGTKIKVIDEIIDMRSHSKLLTFATTNTPKLSDLYDDRTISRLHGLFNVLAINHKIDFRKK